jgi:hypothetical protein
MKRIFHDWNWLIRKMMRFIHSRVAIRIDGAEVTYLPWPAHYDDFGQAVEELSALIDSISICDGVIILRGIQLFNDAAGISNLVDPVISINRLSIKLRDNIVTEPTFIMSLYDGIGAETLLILITTTLKPPLEFDPAFFRKQLDVLRAMITDKALIASFLDMLWRCFGIGPVASHAFSFLSERIHSDLSFAFNLKLRW